MHRIVGMSLIVLAAVLALAGCSGDEVACCDCLVSNDCWDTQYCPEEPQASCEWTLGDGELPSYAGNEADVCFAAYPDCRTAHCEAECEGLF